MSLDRLAIDTTRHVQPTAPAPGATRPGAVQKPSVSFEETLRSKLAPLPQAPVADENPATDVTTPALKFSAHAQSRLLQRGIVLTGPQMARLDDAVTRAADKGARDSVVLLDDTAMVVSVANRTVITALGLQQARDSVFTNIDSAVIA